MNGQYSCEGPQGKKSLLTNTKPGQGMRELKPKVCFYLPLHFYILHEFC